jgi:hypothetical protein
MIFDVLLYQDNLLAVIDKTLIAIWINSGKRQPLTLNSSVFPDALILHIINAIILVVQGMGADQPGIKRANKRDR